MLTEVGLAVGVKELGVAVGLIVLGALEGEDVGAVGFAVGLRIGVALGLLVGAEVGDNGRQHKIALGGGQLLTRLGAVTSAEGQLLDEHTPIVVG